MSGRMTRAVVAVVMLGFVLPAHAVVKNATIIDALRRQLLSDLDPKVPPTTIDGKGLQVKVQFRIFKVIQVNVASGQLVLKVWRRMRWFDDRLAWNPEEHGGTSTVLVYPNDPSSRGPDNNLWTPHVVLYNSKAREGSLFDPGAAWVRSDGRVHWSIPGTIDVTCRFSGLVNFPNDQLSCPIEVASWSLADDVTELTFFDEPTDPEVLAKGDRGCAEMSVQSAATAMSYMEYQLNPHETECLKYTRVYPCCPDAPWTQLWIVVKMKRTSQFYMRLIQFPGIALTLLSFTAFWMDACKTPGRIGFSASLLLSSIVLQNTASASLPKCAEWVWIDYLNVTNMIFCMVALLETAIAIYVAFGGIGVVNEEGADKCDDWARKIIPALYLSVVAFIYNVNPVRAGTLEPPSLSSLSPLALHVSEILS